MKYCLVHGGISENDYVGHPECVFAFCPPPEVGLTFEEVDQLVDPSEEELIQMDMNAEVLEQDFISGGDVIVDIESQEKRVLNMIERFFHEN